MQSNETTQRQIVRAEELVLRTAGTAATDFVALKALSSDMLRHCQAFKVADAAVKSAERSAAREVKEALDAMAPARKFFDETRQVLMAKVPGEVIQAAASFTTPDDFLAAVEDQESLLEAHKDQDWAKGLHEKIGGVLDAAMKEQKEATGALAALQKAKAERRSAALGARPLFVQFRRVVRATFGRQSREYRSLLDRHGVAAEDDIETPGTPAPTPA